MRQKKHPSYMYLILVNCVILLLFYVVKSFFINSEIAYLLFGAQFSPLVSGGQWYRIVTAMFMHGGLHLAFNMYALYILGSNAEALYGTYRFLSFYLLSGIVGNIATQIFTTMRYPLVRVAQYLVLWVHSSVLDWKDTPFYLKPMTGTALLPMIILNIAGLCLARV